MNSLMAVIEKLEAWREHDYHKDRQLADEVLIADRWICEPQPEWEGGVRWYLPGNPEISASESHRPHVIHDLNTAVGVIPPDHSLRLIVVGKAATAEVQKINAPASTLCFGVSMKATIAVLIAAEKAKRALMEAA